MALSLKDPETDALARQVAGLTGESLTEAVRISLKERLVRERLKKGRPAGVAERLEEISRRHVARPILDPRTDDEIMGWDESGLPT